MTRAGPGSAWSSTPAPDDWTAAELTGHVAEFPVTFAERSEQIAATPGLTVGRAETDPGRLAAVARLAGAGPAEAAREVRAGVERAAEILSRLPPAAWQATATHRTQGTRTVEQMVEAFIANHLREHLAQARRTIEAARQAQPGS